MILRPKFLVICILLYALGCLVSGTSNGGKCRRDSQCDSGNCCGVWPFKRCRECCKDSDCPSGSNCKYVKFVIILIEIERDILCLRVYQSDTNSLFALEIENALP